MDDRYNLIYNGNFKEGDDGWAATGGSYTLDTSVTHDGSYGSICITGSSWGQLPYKQLVPINTAHTYAFSFDLYKETSANTYCYSFMPVYDKYGTEIGVYMVNHAGDTTLAAELKNGDTTAKLTNASSFYVNNKNDYYRLGICDSPAWGYNRYFYNQKYCASATNTSTNTITLQSAWAGGTWKAGTPVARFNDGATYIYPTSWNKGPNGVWTHVMASLGPSVWRYSAVNAKVCQSSVLNWKFYVTNFRLENTSFPQEREYNGTALSSNNGMASVQKTWIANCSSLHESATKNARYIRDFCSGNTANNSNHWCEIQAWDKYGRNVALGSIGSATTRNGTRSLITGVSMNGVNNTSNANYIKTHTITKGAQVPISTWIGLDATLGVIIDLGQVFEIETIKIWHYYADGRTYHNTKTEISCDKLNWETVFDSSISGEYKESTNGHIIDFNKRNMSISSAGIYKTNMLYEI